MMEPKIRHTDSGVAVDLRTLYMYPDGHANITFADGSNWPLADGYELVEALVSRLLQPMQKEARRSRNTVAFL